MITKVFTPPAGRSTWPHVSKWTRAEWSDWCLQAGMSAAEFDQYWIARYRHGVAIQVTPSLRKKWEREGDKRLAAVDEKNLYWLYLPSPKAVAFHESRALNLLYGGARGGAKSHTLRWDVHKRCLAVRNYRAIIFRRTLTELRDNHIDKIRLEIQDGLPADYKEGDKLLVYQNGSTCRLAHCENEGDEDKYLSSEYDSIDPDELATFTRKQIFGIMGSARSVKDGVVAVFRSSSNPGGAHTLWCIDWFMDRCVSEEDDPYYEPTDWDFLPSKLYDNPHLMDPDGTFRTYEKRLGGNTPERRRQLLEGDWSAIGGQFFPELRRDTHVADRDREVSGVLWERWLDWGYNAPGVCYWVACLPDGRLYVRHEYKFTQTIASEAAQTIDKMTRALEQTLGTKIKIRKSVADPSMWNHTGHTGESIAETFGRYGVPLQKGDNEREIGWQRMRHFLALAPDQSPWLQWHPSCVYAIRSIATLVSDKKSPDDVDTTGDDHAADAHRYGVMARPAPSTSQQAPVVQPGSIAWLRQRFKKQPGLLTRGRHAAA